MGSTHSGVIHVSIPANTIQDTVGTPNTQTSAQTAVTSNIDSSAGDFFLVDTTDPTAPTGIALHSSSTSPGSDTTPLLTVTVRQDPKYISLPIVPVLHEPVVIAGL